MSDGINKADELVELAISGNVPVYKSSTGGEKKQAAKSGGSVGHKIYTQLMNGVSHMLSLIHI